MVTDRPSLADPGLGTVWELVRRRLESHGVDNRGRVTLPRLPSSARLTLTAVTGRRLGATLDLRALEAGLVRLGIGADLPAALAALAHPVSDAPARRRAERAGARQAREAARAEAATWREPWAGAWIDEVVRAGGVRGLDTDAARALVRSVRRVLDHLDPEGEAPVSRVDLAARVLGDAHALDAGTRLEAATTRALAHRLGPARGPDLWERAGAHLDRTSGAVLTWALPLVPGSGLHPLTTAATTAGVPVHLTRYALRRHPATVAPGTVVLVVENPRVVEAAAESQVPSAVVAGGGNPSGTVRLLVDQLLTSGAELRYHGDFDAAGLAICARMAAAGCTPWRMAATDYRRAITDAARAGVDLPLDPSPCGPTPWDPDLRETFDRHRRIVHEERLLPELLDPR